MDLRDNAEYDFSSKDMKYFTAVGATDKRQVEKSDQPLPSDASSKSENTTFHLPNNEQGDKAVCGTGDEGESEGIEELKNVSPNEFRKKKNGVRDEKKCSRKTARFVEEVNTEESDELEKPTEETQKYPVVYVPIY